MVTLTGTLWYFAVMIGLPILMYGFLVIAAKKVIESKFIHRTNFDVQPLILAFVVAAAAYWTIGVIIFFFVSGYSFWDIIVNPDKRFFLLTSALLWPVWFLFAEKGF